MSEDQKEKVWDVVRACFYLLAGIIWAQIILGFSIWAACSYSIFVGVIPMGSCKDVTPNVMELMVGGLAVVMAFSGRAK
jgi:hypothetical protein